MDLDEFAAGKGYTPGGSGTPVGAQIPPEVLEAIIDGRAKGYSWTFIVSWLKEEYDIVISASTLSLFLFKTNPETR